MAAPFLSLFPPKRREPLWSFDAFYITTARSGVFLQSHTGKSRLYGTSVGVDSNSRA
jgi:hypothetical protein